MTPVPTPAELFDLRGRVALVIGGTGTLCGTMAEGLAQAGAEVLIVGRSAEKARARLQAIEAAGGTGRFLQADLHDRASVEALAEAVAAAVPRVDILVNGAGVNSATPFFEIGEDELEAILSLNLKVPFWACQCFGRGMVERRSGTILNVGSISGQTPLSRVFSYSASKAALHNLSRNLAREWAPHNVRVNTLIPGFFPAEQNRRVLTPERVEAILGHTPAQRFGEPQELIAATLLLASDRAGAFLTGHELVVDGGFSATTI